MRSIKDPRHMARILAVMDLYNLYFHCEDTIFERFNTEDLDIGKYSSKLRNHIVEGVRSNIQKIDNLVNEISEPIKTTDLDLLLLQIVRCAVFEGFIAKSVPSKVAIDEAIEVTRDFGLDLSVKKVSGILGKIYDKFEKEKD